MIKNFLGKNSYWISIVISFIAISVSLLRTPPFEVDWAGFVLGVLSLFITILIGWQIFLTYNFKREKEEVFKSVEFIFIEKYKNDFDKKILDFKREKIIINYTLFKTSHIRKDSFYEEFLHAIEILKTYNEETFDIYFYEHIIVLLHDDVHTREVSFSSKKELADVKQAFKYVLKTIEEPSAKVRLEEIEQRLNTAKVLNFV